MINKSLDFVLTDDLIKEIGNRFEDWIFSGRQSKIKSKEDTLTVRKYRGDLTVCSGLSSQMSKLINDDFERDGIEEDG